MDENTYEVAVDAVRDFHTSKAASDNAVLEIKKEHLQAVSDRKIDMYASAYGVAVMIVKMADEERAKLFDVHDVKQTRAGQNPFYAPMQVLFRKIENGIEVPDPHHVRYAAAFRAANRRAWTAENFTEKMNDFQLTLRSGKTVKAGGMNGLVRQDIEDNFSEVAEKAQEKESFWACHWQNQQEANPFYVAQLTVKPPVDSQCITVVQQWNETTQEWVVRHVDEDHHASWRKIAKQAVTGFRKAASQLANG